MAARSRVDKVAAKRDETASPSEPPELHDAHARYRKFVEATSQCVWMSDASLVTTFMNARLLALLGYTSDEVIGKPASAFMEADGRAAIEYGMIERSRGTVTRSVELRLKRKDGSDLWTRANTLALLDGDGRFTGTLAMLSDITERRRAEELRMRLAAIVEASSDAIVSMSSDLVIESWNQGAAGLFGWTENEAIGRSAWMLVPESDVEAVRLQAARVVDGERMNDAELRLVRKDGENVLVSFSASPMRDANGAVVGLAAFVRDVSERKRAQDDLKRVELQLQQAQKMEAVGRLAGGVAHDFNNILSVILSYSELLRAEVRPGEPMREALDEICSAGQRATSLTRQLLAFSRQQITELRILNLNDVVGGIESMLRRVLREDIDLTVLTGQNLWLCKADRGQMEQVLMNLVVNARDAMPEGGKVTIETSNSVLDAIYVRQHPDATTGPHVVLTISDSGVGMDRATQARIFEPFFTTKPQEKGTGLGLSTVYGIVKQAGGNIWVQSEPTKGTTFRIDLPRARGATNESMAPPPRPAALGGSETILLVEDEEHVRAVVRTILRAARYNVLEASNGGEALLLCEQHSGRIDLLLTDVVMPRLSGRELAERLAVVRPEMKVLFMSGYTKDTMIHEAVLEAGIQYLQKPITPDALRAKVRQVLDVV
jgi:PAS domain S-box-containing protein